MAEVKWIKITTNMFEDEKIDFIESLPEADAILVIWVKLLAQAGKCNSNGFIFLTENIPYTEEMLAHKFRRPLNVVKLALSTFKNLGMIKLDDMGHLMIANWDKHQNIEGLEKIREKNRIRQARYREKQNLLPESNVTDNVTVTPSNALDIDIDKEVDIDIEEDKENNIIILNSDEAQFFKILKGIENYPLDRQKDLDMYNRLKERYPTLNLIESLKDWATYKLDKPLKAKDNPRSQINTSFKKYVEWGKNLKGGNTSGKHESTNGKSAETPKYDTSKWLYKGGK